MNEAPSITRESLTVPTRYGDAHILAIGPQDAPPLVLIPALGVSSKMWQPNIDALSCEHRIYALDTIGDLGQSVLYNLDEYPRNGQSYSDWLVDVFNELGIKQADVIGASMGGWIAINHAIHAPELVCRIVLLAPMGLPSWWTTLKVLSQLWSVFLFPTRSNIDRIIGWALGDDPQVHNAFAGFIRMGAKSWNQLRVAPPLPLPDDQLRMINAPLLLMLGERDNVIGNALEIAKRAKRHIPRVEVEIFAEAGHMLSTEKPELINTRILKFLRDES